MRDKLAVLNVTGRCNHTCAYCSEGTERTPRDVALSQVEVMLDELCARRYTRVHYMGGETTLRRDVLELLDLTRSKGLQVGVATNGTRLADRAFAEELLRRICCLELSLVSPDRDDYRAVTGRDHQPRVLAGLRHVVDLRRTMPALVPLTINVVVCALNQAAPWQAARLLAEMELPQATFLELVRARRKGRAEQQPALLLDAVATDASFRPALELARQQRLPVLFRGLPTCALVEFVGHNHDAVDAVLEPSVAYMNRRPIYEGIDIAAHHDEDLAWRRRMARCDGCPLAALCQGLDDDLPADWAPLCTAAELPEPGQVEAALAAGPLGALLRHRDDGRWPPPFE